MQGNTAYIELKYGPINGGNEHYFVVTDVALIVHNHSTQYFAVETRQIKSDLDIVFHFADIDELGTTRRRYKKVVNLKSGQEKPLAKEQTFDKLPKHIALNTRYHKHTLKNFVIQAIRNHNISRIISFGQRDIAILEKVGVYTNKIKAYDFQQKLNKETNYYFSLNKLAKIIGFTCRNNDIESNNLSFTLPVSPRYMREEGALHDAARLFMVYQEYMTNQDAFFIKAALQLQKIGK